MVHNIRKRFRGDKTEDLIDSALGARILRNLTPNPSDPFSDIDPITGLN